MKALSKSSVGADVLVRVIGITLIVADHATSMGQSGKILAGLNMLLLVAGYSFARFLPDNARASDIRASFFGYGKSLAIPCLIMLVISAIVLRRFSLPDLLFIGNWFTFDHVSLFPAWYPMELLQYLVLLALIFSLPNVARYYAQRPFLTIICLLVFAVAERAVLSQLWKMGIGEARGPHLMLWNFVAGWLIFVARISGRTRNTLSLIALAVTILCAFATWGIYIMRFWSTFAGAALLLFVTRLTVPFAVSRLASILSQSTLAIFLLHMPALTIYNWMTGTINTVGSFIFAMSVPCVGWIAMSAALRAYHNLRSQPDVSDHSVNGPVISV